MFVGMKKINPGINNKYFWIDALSFFFFFLFLLKLGCTQFAHEFEYHNI